MVKETKGVRHAIRVEHFDDKATRTSQLYSIFPGRIMKVMISLNNTIKLILINSTRNSYLVNKRVYLWARFIGALL